MLAELTHKLHQPARTLNMVNVCRNGSSVSCIASTSTWERDPSSTARTHRDQSAISEVGVDILRCSACSACDHDVCRWRSTAHLCKQRGRHLRAITCTIRDGMTMRSHESEASTTGQIIGIVMRMTQKQSRHDAPSHKYVHWCAVKHAPTSMFTICSMDLQQLILTLQTLICLLQFVQNITRPATTLHFLNTTHLAPQNLDTRARGMCMA